MTRTHVQCVAVCSRADGSENKCRCDEVMSQVDRVQQHIPADPVDADVLVHGKVRLECVLTCCSWHLVPCGSHQSLHSRGGKTAIKLGILDLPVFGLQEFIGNPRASLDTSAAGIIQAVCLLAARRNVSAARCLRPSDASKAC